MSVPGLKDLAVILALLAPLLYAFEKRKGFPLPPGPHGLPFIGNALSIPTNDTHRFFKDLSDKFGSKILYLEAFGQPIILLNDVQTGVDLLEKRSAKYSSRPHMPMSLDIMKLNDLFFLLPYNDAWRRHRKLFTQYFSLKTLNRDKPKVEDFIRKGLLPNIYQYPRDFASHIRSCIGGLFIAITYGVQINRLNDPLIKVSEEALDAITAGCAPGRFFVDVFPVLKYVPGWMPGTAFKAQGREWSATARRMRDALYEANVEATRDGNVRESLVSYFDNGNSAEDIPITDVKGLAQQVYAAGLETTSVSLMTFILVMLLHPDIQKRAKEELDSVMGHDRLPEFSDKPELPYLSAVLKEVFRWNPIVPLGVPHYTDEEDEYQGYRIPKNSIIMANAYGMLYDESVFPEPHLFKPERFLDKDGKLSADIAVDPEAMITFGFGRRSCPGAHLALPVLYLGAASILATFDILPELDGHGLPIKVIPQFTSASLTSEPLPFPCRLVPREDKPVEDMLKDYLHLEKI
ncbi:hypothetical protein AGABI2DRAFT_212609 [Agaricus bisporus var. bisporus H97]|uniref:hypothetical protein n=1 Tax=Agaricus bisporus var. bisporus (strain H97 / ATCC MYA-4626 / FGSC 10389) TaxID=936046 RepID=UPI00029F7B13|nr:hypothetical protein AGABI2DRAFT_212609 [Agaricus bisporus var. bisporus H97]EKV42014.1 hypothetical protein AGABI2DRAFT_212609 [Agaricus bisporus var. bisporus H97]